MRRADKFMLAVIMVYCDYYSIEPWLSSNKVPDGNSKGLLWSGTILPPPSSIILEPDSGLIHAFLMLPPLMCMTAPGLRQISVVLLVTTFAVIVKTAELSTMI